LIVDVFFACFSLFSVMKDSSDTIGNRPFINCCDEMKLYDDCMFTALNASQNKINDDEGGDYSL